MRVLVGPTNRTVTLTGSPMGATVKTGGEIMVPKLKTILAMLPMI